MPVTQASVEPASEALPFEPAIQEFSEYLQVQKRYSVHTISSYQRDLREVAKSLQGIGVDDWSAANPFNMRTVIARQHGDGLSGRSLARRLSAVRSLFRYFIKQGRIDVNPVAEVPAPKDQHGLLLRDRAIFELIYSSGLRLAEVVQLDVDSIDRQSGQVRVTGKGAKTRVLPVGSHALNAVKEWLARRNELMRGAGDETALFISRRGTRRQAATCVRFRNCWVTLTSVQRRSTHILIFSIWRRYTSAPIQGRQKRAVTTRSTID